MYTLQINLIATIQGVIQRTMKHDSQGMREDAWDGLREALTEYFSHLQEVGPESDGSKVFRMDPKFTGSGEMITITLCPNR